MIKKIAKAILPANTSRRRAAVKFARATHLLSARSPDINYSEWVERSEPFLWSKIERLSYQPLISIVVPVFNPPSRYFMPMVYSVINQEHYDNWELVLVNASNKPAAIKMTNDAAMIDKRIKVVEVKENKGIAGNTNLGISSAAGEYLGLLDHDDVLAPRALYEVARVLQVQDKPGIIYSDEDKLTENGEHRFDVHFKSDWSLQLFREVNYMNHFMVMDKKLVDKAKGYRPGYEGAQDFDLFLRLVDEKPGIAHIPKILYHWRAAHGSTAMDFSTKKNIVQAGVRALEDHLDRNNQKGRVNYHINQPGFYTISYEPKASDKVAILIMPSENTQQYTYLAKQVVSSLGGTTIPTEVFIGATIPQVSLDHAKVSVVSCESKEAKEFVKESLDKTKANIVIVFNAAAIPKSKHWVEEFAGAVSQVDSIGAIAPVLIDPAVPGGEIKDFGYISHGGNAIGLFQGLPLKAHTYFGNTVWARSVDYLSGRVCAMRRDVFEKYFNDAAFFENNNLYSAAPFKHLRKDGMEAIVYPQVQMDFRGELKPPVYNSPRLNPNISIKRYDIGLLKNMNVPPEVSNES